MPDPHTCDFSVRLRQLPRQLLLALLNGTAILVIAAALLALAATANVTHLAETVAATMTDAVLTRVDVKPRRVLEKLEDLTVEIQSLRSELQEKKVYGGAPLDPAIDRLYERLAALETAIDQLRDGRSQLLDEATARLSLSLGQALQDFGACKATPASP
ncbi:hypothetical protein [Methyloceanibacter sp. wino2]|uniref:hypothetical protein n=1 Tax=Methyloceanibacter sp. wino2 TaxID=2170729 RepID=UPI000D3E0E69|nr:hypothetical protein [Methyloceanibacter sp. wino2]